LNCAASFGRQLLCGISTACPNRLLQNDPLRQGGGSQAQETCLAPSLRSELPALPSQAASLLAEHGAWHPGHRDMSCKALHKILGVELRRWFLAASGQ